MEVLILSIGAGDRGDLESTLYQPVLKSVHTGGFSRIILVPSKVTEARADVLKSRVEGCEVSIRTLPEAGMENDANSCCGHFDDVLGEVLADGCSPRDITVDFTRGTKAMSAAIVMAAVGRGISILRYIEGQRDERGTVIPGTEVIRNVSPELARTRRDLDVARKLLDCHQFRAVEAMFDADESDYRYLDQLYPRRFQEEVVWAHWMARFWGAWDRFDYSGAKALLDRKPDFDLPDEWRSLSPDKSRREFLSRLARGVSGPPENRLAPARDLAADIMANAYRRLRAGEHEDAFVRAYRLLEMSGQIRLFSAGLNSESIDVTRIQEWLDQENAQFLVRRGKAQLPRARVASLLRYLRVDHDHRMDCNSALAKALEKRNDSLLMHGFSAQTPGFGPDWIRQHLETLRDIYEREDTGNRERFRSAVFPFPDSGKAEDWG